MEPIRVLHVIGTMNRGGAETLLMEIYRHIDRTKIQFEFLVISYDDGCGVFDEEIEVLGGKLNYFRTRFYKNPFKYYRELNEFFKNNNYYAAVHGHLYKCQVLQSGLQEKRHTGGNSPFTYCFSAY